MGGAFWCSWDAWRWFSLEAGLSLDTAVQAKADAWHDANQAGWWWPNGQFVIAVDRPTEIHLEQIKPQGWGSHQLHREDGPAIAWGDEWALHFEHGRRVKR